MFQERDFPESTDVTKESSRDADIRILAGLKALTETRLGSHFLVTGSHAIEALTGVRLQHNDIDANVYTPDITQSLKYTAEKIEKMGIVGRKFKLIKQKTDRLDYDVYSPAYPDGVKRLELQFEEFGEVSVTNQGIQFISQGRDGRTLIVPTSESIVSESTGSFTTLRTKSLEYLIATWAIRISGTAESQKRQVRQSDMEHLKLLMSAGFNEEQVVRLIQSHTQAPHGVDGIKVMSTARQTARG